MPKPPFDPTLRTPFLRDLNDLCVKHGVSKIVAGYEDPDVSTRQTMVFVKQAGGVEWSLNAAVDVQDFIIEKSDTHNRWKENS